ncbi:hypothetical protein DFH08DRAFT_812961 [Mycena albidolilacea]|uniref:Uncharacterized protein n=1 Tax=Mycena albidolilacea TaxID=1033008 RepID=A0AAD7ENL4_9AGAR|nr:hypothetical protein DFH08DRAFT_812961 [Mycena albidolilacea]
MDTGIPAGTFGPTRTRTRKNRTRVRVGSKTRTGCPRVLNAPAGPQTRRSFVRSKSRRPQDPKQSRLRKDVADMRLRVKCSRRRPCEKTRSTTTEVASDRQFYARSSQIRNSQVVSEFILGLINGTEVLEHAEVQRSRRAYTGSNIR